MATPSSAAPRRERFADQAVRLRWRAGLTQRELAGLLRLSEETVQRWEAGQALPGAAHLRALIALYLQRGAFAPGEEEEGATAFWDAPREPTPAGARRPGLAADPARRAPSGGPSRASPGLGRRPRPPDIRAAS